VLGRTFEFKGKVCRQVTTLMVPTQHEDSFGIPHFDGNEQQIAFNRKVASVHVIAQKQVPGLARVTSNVQQLHQVKVLSMYVSANSNWGVNFQHVWFCAKHLSRRANEKQRVLVGYSAFVEKVLLQDFNVCFCWIDW